MRNRLCIWMFWRWYFSSRTTLIARNRRGLFFSTAILSASVSSLSVFSEGSRVFNGNVGVAICEINGWFNVKGERLRIMWQMVIILGKTGEGVFFIALACLLDNSYRALRLFCKNIEIKRLIYLYDVLTIFFLLFFHRCIILHWFTSRAFSIRVANFISASCKLMWPKLVNVAL